VNAAREVFALPAVGARHRAIKQQNVGSKYWLEMNRPRRELTAKYILTSNVIFPLEFK
jgi:hypothetical protein